MQIYLRGKSRVFGRYKSGSWRSRGPDLSGQLQIRQSKGTHIHIWWCDVAKQVMSQDLGMSVVQGVLRLKLREVGEQAQGSSCKSGLSLCDITNFDSILQTPMSPWLKGSITRAGIQSRHISHKSLMRSFDFCLNIFRVGAFSVPQSCPFTVACLSQKAVSYTEPNFASSRFLLICVSFYHLQQHTEGHFKNT